VRGACHFVACARPPGEAVSGAGEVCGCEGGGSRGQGLLSTGRFYLAPALWPLRPRVPRIYVFRVMCGGRLHGADGHGVSRGRGVRPGSPGRVTTLRRAYAVRGGGRVGTRCCAPPPRVTRPVYGLAFYKTPAGFYHASDTRKRPRPRASTTTARAPRREIVSPSTTAPQRTGRGTRRHRTIIDSPSRS